MEWGGVVGVAAADGSSAAGEAASAIAVFDQAAECGGWPVSGVAVPGTYVRTGFRAGFRAGVGDAPAAA